MGRHYNLRSTGARATKKVGKGDGDKPGKNRPQGEVLLVDPAKITRRYKFGNGSAVVEDINTGTETTYSMPVILVEGVAVEVVVAYFVNMGGPRLVPFDRSNGTFHYTYLNFRIMRTSFRL